MDDDYTTREGARVEQARVQAIASTDCPSRSSHQDDGTGQPECRAGACELSQFTECEWCHEMTLFVVFDSAPSEHDDCSRATLSCSHPPYCEDGDHDWHVDAGCPTCKSALCPVCGSLGQDRPPPTVTIPVSLLDGLAGLVGDVQDQYPDDDGHGHVTDPYHAAINALAALRPAYGIATYQVSSCPICGTEQYNDDYCSPECEQADVDSYNG